MSRALGPVGDQRTIQTFKASQNQFTGYGGRILTLYTDTGRTQLADVRSYDPANPTVIGSALTGSKVVLDKESRAPLFWFPDNVTRLYGRVLNGPNVELRAENPATRSAAAAVARTGMEVPTDWGRFWYPKLAAAKAGTGIAKVAMIGTSVAQGYWASSLKNTSYAALLRAGLQTYGGNGGSGYQGMQFSDTFVSGAPANAYNRYKTIGDLWAQTGTWNTPTFWFGPSLGTLDAATNGATVTTTFVGTAVDVWFYNAYSSSPFTITIDGGAPTTVTPGAGLGADLSAQFATVSGLAAGQHTVVVTSGSTGVRLVGFRGRNTTGVIVDNYGIAGMESRGWSNQDGQNSGTYMGGWRNPADLIIIGAPLNDIVKASRTVATTGTTSGQPTLTNAFFRDSDIGRRVTGAGIPDGATITAINAGTNATMSTNATATATVTVTVTDPDPVGRWVKNTTEYLNGVLDNIYGGGTTPDGKVDLIFLNPLMRGSSDPGKIMGEMGQATYGLAKRYGAAVIDIGAMYGQSWSRGYNDHHFGNPGDVTTWGNDDVHPGDLGHAFIANNLLDLVRRGA